MALTRFHRVLAESLSLADSEWSYVVSDLPDQETCNEAGYMKSCGLVADVSNQRLSLQLTKIPENRAIVEHHLHRLIHFTCSNFRLHLPDGQPATFKESSSYIARFLKTGIVINGTRYHFYGHSNSQLKSKSCFMMAGTQEEVVRAVEGLGDFSKITSVAKKAKRIGLLFSTAHSAIDVEPNRCQDIPDIERDDYVFTDGCGLISPNLVQILVRKHPIIFRNQRIRPSVLQIRYRGYKGVVIVEPQMKPPTWLKLRKSMCKFSGVANMSFAVVEYSKPFTYGYLNDEFILLLHALGVSREVFLQKQRQHLEVLATALSDPRTAFRLFSSLGLPELAEKTLLEGHQAIRGAIAKVVTQEYAKMLNKRGEQKCRVLIPQSRLLFGVCDPRGCLDEGECFVSPTHDNDGIARAISGYVLVSRNPCLHPGDLQKLLAVPKPELTHMVDCVVFPVRGRRPAADMMSGGDLDGDTFAEAAEYPPPRESISFKAITHEDRIDYFAQYSSMQLGRIKNLYLRWARLRGPLSSECQELNRLFSQCVDAYKVKIPDRLLELPLSLQPADKFILDVLHEASHDFIRETQVKVSSQSLPSIEALEGMLEQPSLLSQFELARITLRWCQSNHAHFEEFFHFFDPLTMSSEERAWLLAHLPERPETPSIVMNDLLHSDILQPPELERFDLQNPRTRWRCVFNSRHDRLANLLNTVERTFPFFARKLLVLQVHDRLSIAIYLPRRIERLDEFAINQSGRLFAFPHQKAGQVPRGVVPSRHNSILYYDHNTFQLFEGKRANTFVYIARAPNDDGEYRSIKGTGARARAREQTIQEGVNYEWIASVALKKFSNILARSVGRLNREGISNAELYAISNTDTRSYKYLDLWLERIDTTDVYQNFGASIGDDADGAQQDAIDWEQQTEFVVSVARDKNFDLLSQLTDARGLSPLLNTVWQMSSHELAMQLFSHHLAKLPSVPPSPVQCQALQKMIDFVISMPSLVIHFVNDIRSQDGLAEPIKGIIAQAGPTFLRALIMCTRKADNLVISYVQQVMEGMNDLPTETLRSLIELLAMTGASAEVALSIVVDAFEPYADRIGCASPMEARYALKALAGIAIDHIEEASEVEGKPRGSNYTWTFNKPPEEKDGNLVLECALRIDAPKIGHIAVGDHVVFTSITTPSDISSSVPIVFEAIVQNVQAGQATLHCLRRPPAFFQRCTWQLTNCGSFTTSRTMMDAIVTLIAERENCCGVYDSLLPDDISKAPSSFPDIGYTIHKDLNRSQNAAVQTSLQGPLTCIWGPPGTGKTHTIVTLCQEILERDSHERLLVTAPTHNAVDNVMRQYIKRLSSVELSARVPPLRVSTEVRKVSPDLVNYTCDAMLGKDINQFPAARRKAQKQIRGARLIFTTCVGAGLGLLRSERFDTVIVDEASQQTEPASLIPLVKGAGRVILVGDHVQLRATVRPYSQTLDFDVSLFERLWTQNSDESGSASVRKVMLDTQYRMHPAICAFPSKEFYDGKLKTADRCEHIQLPVSSFPWPLETRTVFIQASSPEDLGQASKSNVGQASLNQEIIRLLRAPTDNTKAPTASHPQDPSIAILTPYTQQADLLRRLCPDEAVASIDGFQGQEADIIVFVTVRSNVHGNIGFLRDMRRLNVVLTRARSALVIIGDRGTLTGQALGTKKIVKLSETEDAMTDGKQKDASEEEASAVWNRLICGMVVLDGGIFAGATSSRDDVEKRTVSR